MWPRRTHRLPTSLLAFALAACGIGQPAGPCPNRLEVWLFDGTTGPAVDFDRVRICYGEQCVTLSGACKVVEGAVSSVLCDTGTVRLNIPVEGYFDVVTLAALDADGKVLYTAKAAGRTETRSGCAFTEARFTFNYISEGPMGGAGDTD